MELLQKLFSVSLTYFLKVKDLNQDLPRMASNHSGATCANKDLNRDLPTVAHNHTGATRTSRFKSRSSEGGEHPLLFIVQMTTKLFLQIYLHLYGTCCRVALVITLLTAF